MPVAATGVSVGVSVDGDVGVSVDLSIDVSVRNLYACTRQGCDTPALVPVAETGVVGVLVSAKQWPMPARAASVLLPMLMSVSVSVPKLTRMHESRR